jgi:DNA-directed RNA polymerase beta subunit
MGNQQELPEDFVLFSPQIEVFAPFAAMVDPSRTNMTSKQLLQNVISKNTDTPLIIDKMYRKLTNIDSPFAEFAEDDGHILFKEDEILIIYYNNKKKIVTKSIPKIKKLINNSLSIKYVADIGPIKKGELLFDYTNMDPKSLLPKVGYRTNILFHSFFGYTSDDALVVSESFAKRVQIEYSQKIFIPITKNWKYLRNPMDLYFYRIGDKQSEEAYVKYFNIDTGEHFLSEIHNISEQPTMFFTKSIAGIEKGEILQIKVHKNTKKTFKELKEEYLYTPGLIDEIEEFYNKNLDIFSDIIETFESIGIDKIEATKLADEIFENHYSVKKFPKTFETKCKEEFNIDPADVDFFLEVTVGYTANSTRGDKFTNLFAGKGTISLIVPDTLMPKDPQTGKPFDMVFNPLGIFGRNNWGVIFELALSKIIKDVENCAEKCLIDDKLNHEFTPDLIARIKFITEHFIKRTDENYYRKLTQYFIPNLLSGLNHENEEPLKMFIKDIQKNGFFIYVSNFPNITYNQFLKEFIKPYAEEFNININKSKIKIDKELISWFRNTMQFKNEILNDVYETEIEAFHGMNYILKLYHTSYSKFTAVSLANSYSKITGQPARGRKRTGGQHLSWQTFAALLGHKEHNAILKELYTIKSDAPVKDKENFIMQFITKGEYNLKPKYTSLTKRAVNNALKMLGMEFDD